MIDFVHINFSNLIFIIVITIRLKKIFVMFTRLIRELTTISFFVLESCINTHESIVQFDRSFSFQGPRMINIGDILLIFDL